MILTKYLQPLRIHQWYKNLVIFLALFFSGNIFNITLLSQSGIAFVSFCLISSANYILNDLFDLKKDKLHPEKKLRPLASGNITKIESIFMIILLIILSIYLGLKLQHNFIIFIILIFILSSFYTLILKQIILLDILTISTLFVIRAIAGAYAINVIVSPWLILCPFFLSLFLSIGKRHSEILMLKETASQTRTVLKHYTLELTNSLMLISTTLLIISYALYSFLSPYNHLLYTLPFAMYVIFRFYYLINIGSEIGRKAEKVIYDYPLLIGTALWIITTLFLIYY